jgi:hypothetical protein
MDVLLWDIIDLGSIPFLLLALIVLVFWKKTPSIGPALKRIPKKEVCGRGTSCINAITRSKHEASILSI